MNKLNNRSRKNLKKIEFSSGFSDGFGVEYTDNKLILIHGGLYLYVNTVLQDMKLVKLEKRAHP